MPDWPFIQWFESFLLAWIPLFVATDPIGLVPIFLSITRDCTLAERKSIAAHATLTAALVAVVFMFLGKSIFRFLGISVADFQIAGGLILFILAAGDLVGSENKVASLPRDIGIVPLGLPMIAGPALLTTLLIQVDSVGVVFTLLALVVNMVLLALALEYSNTIAERVGARGLRAVSKIVALLLAAIAVNMIRRGWQVTVGS